MRRVNFRIASAANPLIDVAPLTFFILRPLNLSLPFGFDSASTFSTPFCSSVMGFSKRCLALRSAKPRFFRSLHTDLVIPIYVFKSHRRIKCCIYPSHIFKYHSSTIILSRTQIVIRAYLPIHTYSKYYIVPVNVQYFNYRTIHRNAVPRFLCICYIQPFNLFDDQNASLELFVKIPYYIYKEIRRIITDSYRNIKE